MPKEDLGSGDPEGEGLLQRPVMTKDPYNAILPGKQIRNIYFLFSYHYYTQISVSFDLDLANNLEVEFLVYSWDPQLRHRLCYRSSLRLSTLFGKGQSFQQVALR